MKPSAASPRDASAGPKTRKRMGCAASTGPLYRDEHDFATTAAYYDKDEDVKKDWVENEQLGEGMFARVVKVTRKSTNQQYACKVLRKTTVIEDNEIKLAPKASDLLREIDCLRRVGGAKGCLTNRIAKHNVLAREDVATLMDLREALATVVTAENETPLRGALDALWASDLPPTTMLHVRRIQTGNVAGLGEGKRVSCEE